MKFLKTIGFVAALASATPSFATLIDFENAPANTGVDLGTFYPGVTFGSDVQVITPVTGAHSGVNAITDNFTFDPYLSFAFTSGQTSLSFWYQILSVQAVITTYDVNGNKINSYTVSGATNQTLLSYKEFYVAGSTPIYSVNIDDSAAAGGVGIGGFVTVDDLSYPGIAPNVPETTSTVALLGLAAVGIFAFRKHVVA